MISQFVLLALLAQSPDLSPKRLNKEIVAITEEAAFQGSFWGVVVYAPFRDEYLVRLNPDHNFRPASNMKILTTLLAFHHLGPEFRYETVVAHNGEREGPIVKGDLVVKASGDPSLSGNYSNGALHTDHLIDELCDEIEASGIRVFTGALVGDVHVFDKVSVQKSWEWDDMGHYYAVPITPLSLHDGWIDLNLYADAIGRLHVSHTPEHTPDVKVISELTHIPGFIDIEVERIWGTNRFKFSGNLPPCASKSFTFAAWDPNIQFLNTLRGKLAERGIRFINGIRLSHEPVEADHTLATHVSEPLSQLGRILMKESQNHYADAFLKTTAAYVKGEGSFEAGAELASVFIAEIANTPRSRTGHNIRDGSGLSAQNYLKPDQIVSMLDFGFKQPWWDDWIRTFPAMGLEGTMERRGTADGLTKGFVWAKTGYIYRTRALSGFVETLAGEALFFSILVNNYPGPTSEVNEAQDRICGLMRRLKPNRKVRKIHHKKHMLSSFWPDPWHSDDTHDE